MKIFDKQWALTLLLLPFFKPPVFEYISSLHFIDTLFDMAKIVSFGMIILLYISEKKLSRIMLFITLYQISLFFSTVINNGNYWKLLVSCGTIISFCMITELAVKKNCGLYFKSILNVYIPLSVLNLFIVLIFPQGIAREDYYGNIYYLLGSRNGFSPLFIPLLIFSYIYSGMNDKKYTPMTLFFTMIVSVSILITWSATGVAGLAMLLLFILLIYGRKIASLFNSLTLSVIYIAAFLGIIVFRLQYVFSFIIEKLLHKSMTFTGRTDIWDIALRLIKRSPLFGYGVYEGHGLIFVRGQYYYAHNAVLEVLLQGGAVSLIFYGAIFASAAVSLYKYRKQKPAQILSFGIFTVLTMMLMEAYSTIWIFSLPVIACYIPYITENPDPKKEISETLSNKKYLVCRLKQR